MKLHLHIVTVLSFLFMVLPTYGEPTSAASPTTIESAVVVEEEFILWRVIAVPFILDQVHFLVQADNSAPQRYEGIATPVSKEGLLGGPRQWIVGTRVRSPRSREEIRYAIMAKGRTHNRSPRQSTEQLFIVPETSKSITAEVSALKLPDALREKLLQQKEVLKSYQIQVGAQEESLQRLRDDASVIGNLGKIIELKDEASRTAANVRNLERDIENLKSFLKLARSRPQPKNYATREGQLTSQVSELAQAAKSTESQELQRRSRAEGDLKRKLNIIEQTRMDDYDQLQRTLLKVRRERMRLERDAKSRFNG